MLPDSRRAVERPSSEMSDSSMQLDTDLTPVKEVDTLPVDETSTVVKIPLTDNEPANVLEEGEEILDAPAIDHVTTSAAVVSEGENVEIAETPLPDPTVVHATLAGKEGMQGEVSPVSLGNVIGPIQVW